MINQSDFNEKFWLKEGELFPGADNRYSTVKIIGVDKESVEKYLYEKEDNLWAYAGDYKEIKDIPVITFYTFYISKSEPEELTDIFSTAFPEAVIFADTGWDHHYFAIKQNGNDYLDYKLSWDNGIEPTLYEEYDGFVYADCDVIISINYNGETIETFTGGGRCTEDEFNNYKTEIDSYIESHER